MNLTAGTLSGTGVIRANGGDAEYFNAGGGGGGGRVAVRLTQSGATFASFAVGNISARGGDSAASSGANPSAAGTVYLETQAQSGGGGTVTINHFEASDARTHIPAFTNGVLDELEGAMVIATNWGRAGSTTNAGIGDLLIYTNCYWTLGGWTVTVDVAEHSLMDLLDPEPDVSTNRVDNYDQIIWRTAPDGVVILLR